MSKKLVILISGNGSNLQAVIDSVEKKEIDYSIEAVISNKKSAYGLQRAEKAGIKAIHLPFKKGSDRRAYDAELAELVKSFQPDFVFLLGWMRILSNNFIQHFDKKIINLHPALPNTFAGTHAIQDQFEAFNAGKITNCGIMTHFVPDEGVDSGPVILTKAVPISVNDSLEEFEERIHKAEHQLVIETLKKA